MQKLKFNIAIVDGFWLIKDFIDLVSKRACTRAPSIKQSTNELPISMVFILTMEWLPLPPEFGPSLSRLQEHGSLEKHDPAGHRRNRLASSLGSHRLTFCCVRCGDHDNHSGYQCLLFQHLPASLQGTTVSNLKPPSSRTIGLIGTV